MKKSEKQKVLLAEDHGVVIEALQRLINRQTDLLCCHAIQSARDIFPAVRNHRPDLVLLDIHLKDSDSTDLIAPLVSEFPKLRVLVFSRLDGTSHAEAILKAGASGFITKDEAPQELLTAIRTVLNGEIYLTRKMAAWLVHRLIREKPAHADHAPTPALPLSRRETEIFQLIGFGKKTSQVARELKLSVKTVETHRENIKRKLGLKTASELMLQAVKWSEGQAPKTFLLKNNHTARRPGPVDA